MVLEDLFFRQVSTKSYAVMDGPDGMKVVSCRWHVILTTISIT